MRRNRKCVYAGALLLALLSGVDGARAQPAAARPSNATAQRSAELRERAAKFLLAEQGADGGWASSTGPGVTCLVARALAQEPSIGPQHAAVQRAVEFVKKFQRADGGVYAAEGLLKNYESSVALSMFAALDRKGLEAEISRTRKFLTENQWDEGEGKSLDDPWYGGAGYGRSKRPDLSNTQMMLEALHDSGLPPDDPAYRKALIFIQRCQMLGESNDQPYARGSAQGGFIYSPANNGESKADEIEINGRRELRSYGSMTYAGFKSMLYAGLSKDDPRVKAALGWIQRNWTLDYNPNMPDARSREGLYYYFHVFARALQAAGLEAVEDARGVKRDWRAELVEKLASLQRKDGSWVNEHDRWMEGLPALTTAYSLLALQAAEPPTAK